MKAALMTALLLVGLTSISSATAAAADYPTQWVATDDPAHWRINQTSRTLDGKPIWVATDDNRGGYEELVEVSRDARTVVLRSLKYEGNEGQLTGETYSSYNNGRLVFHRQGHWVD